MKAQGTSAKIGLGLPGPVVARFFPTIKLTDYYSAQKPQYVYLHSKDLGGGARDTVRLLEGYGYSANVNIGVSELLVQIDSVFTDSVYIYLSTDLTLDVDMAGFWAAPGDGCDTLHWVTESESENLGFEIYRRIKPQFFDSLFAVLHTVDTNQEDVSNAAVMAKRGDITITDTGWVKVYKELIPGVKGGTSHGTRNYKKVDYQVRNDVLYQYKLVAIDFSNAEEEYDEYPEAMPRRRLPLNFALFRNYPNPFRTRTFIRYNLPKKTKVALYIYNMQGRLVRRLIQPRKLMAPGFYRVMWDGTDDVGRPLGSGPYIYMVRSDSGRFRKARVMILLR